MNARSVTARATLSDWTADFAALLAEAYALDAQSSISLADVLDELLEGTPMQIRVDGLTAPSRVQSQVVRGATLGRIAGAQALHDAAEHLARDSMAQGESVAGEDIRISSQAWSSLFVEQFGATYVLTPATRLWMVDQVAVVLDEFQIGSRPLRVIPRPLPPVMIVAARRGRNR